QASGTFQLTIEDETDEEQFPDFEDGQLTAIDFMAVSGLGQEDSVITGRITPTLDGQNATATITVTARDDHNQSLGTGTLTATGSFNPNTNVLDLTTITGAIGTIDFTGHIRLSLVNVGNTTLFPATGFASGIVLLSAEDDANGTLAGLDFGGTAGTSSQI
ncbi:MAG TPA: hypothetical protein VEI97_01245, partial [bacterium]|nr:hypothetical protein [bacterium]